MAATRAWDPAAIYMTHFGPADDPRRSSTGLRAWLDRFAREAGRRRRRLVRAALPARIGGGGRPRLPSAAYLPGAPPPSTAYPGLGALLGEAVRPGRRHEHGDDRASAHLAGPGRRARRRLAGDVLNDNHNTFDGVASALARIVPGVSPGQGVRVSPTRSTTWARRSSGPGQRSRPSTTGNCSTRRASRWPRSNRAEAVCAGVGSSRSRRCSPWASRSPPWRSSCCYRRTMTTATATMSHAGGAGARAAAARQRETAATRQAKFAWAAALEGGRQPRAGADPDVPRRRSSAAGCAAA